MERALTTATVPTCERPAAAAQSRPGEAWHTIGFHCPEAKEAFGDITEVNDERIHLRAKSHHEQGT